MYEVYNLCLAYFAFVYLIGFLLSWNINALRYVAIAFLIIFSVNLKVLDTPSLRPMEWVSYLFIIFTIAMPVIGILGGYEEAWWQDWLWSGTAYAAFGTFISASILLWYGNIRRFFIVVFLVLASGVLNDSRTTLLLGVTLVLPLMRVFSKDRRIIGNTRQSNLRSVITSVAALLLLLAMTYQFLDTEGVSEAWDVAWRVSAVTWQTAEDLISGDTERDLDRSLSNQAALDLMNENIFHFLFGAGGLSHQYDLLDRGLSYSGTKVRPTGVPAVVFDGGAMLMVLMFFSAVTSSWIAFKKTTDVCGRLFLSIIPIISFLMLFVANMLDCTLFWLVLKPGFLSKIFLSVQHHQQTLEQH